MSALVRWSESRHVRAEVARVVGRDLPASALRLLEHFEAAGAMRVSAVAECLHIDVSTASLQLRGLRSDGLVSRTADPADGRSGVVAITAEGRSVLARVRAVRCELLAQALGSASPGEWGRAAEVLLRVQQHMLGAG
ncbi:DNA-binding MarR family transcriptional regulator [Streptomyces sp. TLI_171]|nr:DNA-binding MarR family transcriptional regulator [Streptomyces sp. TLI_171]